MTIKNWWILTSCFLLPTIASAQTFQCKWMSERDLLTGTSVSQLAVNNKYQLDVMGRILKWTVTNGKKQSVQECTNTVIENETLRCLVESDLAFARGTFEYLTTKSMFAFDRGTKQLVKHSTTTYKTRSDKTQSSIDRETVYECKQK